MAGLVYPISYKVDSSGLKQAQSHFSDFGAGIKKALGAAAIVGALHEITKGVSSVISAASNLNEVQTAVDAVFGGASSTLKDYANTAASTMGLSQTQFLDAAKTFGVFGKAAGLADSDNAQFATGLTKLASDLASFNNTSTADAISALGAGLRGESEPLRRYGVMLSDAQLRARALEMGIYSGSGALTTQQKVLASQAEIMAQTGIQQGDFAKTSNGLANSTRILTATFEDMKSTVGQAVAPAMATLAQAITPVVTALGPVLNQLVNALTPIFEALPGLIDKLLPPFINLIKLVGSLVEAVMPLLLQVFEALVPILDPIIEVLTTLIQAILPPLATLIQKVLVPALQIFVDILNKYLLPYIDTLAISLGDVLTQAVGVVVELFNQLKLTIDPIVQVFKDLQASTGIDFGKLMLSLNPALMALQALARGLAVVIFTMKMARAVMTGDWGSVAKLTAEGPFAAMDAANKARTDAANAARGQNAYASRYAAMEAAGKAVGLGASGAGSGGSNTFVTPAVVQSGNDTKAKDKAAKAAHKAALAAEKAHAKAIAKAAAESKKLYEEALQVYNSLKDAATAFGISFKSVMSSFVDLAKTAPVMGQFEGQVVDNFKNITSAAQDAFNNKLITQTALDQLTAYASKEQAVLQGIARQRDELAGKISLAQALFSSTKDAVVSFGNITSLLKSQTQTVQQTTTEILNGVATTITKSVEMASQNDLVAEYKKIIDKTKAFAVNLTALKKAGLDSNLFKQIVDAGVDAGGATAEAIIAGGGSTITELNSLFADLQATGNQIAETTTVVMYNNGVDVVGGFIQGLQSQDALLQATATAMATSFADTFTGLINSSIKSTLSLAANQVNNAAPAATVDAASLNVYDLAKQLAGNAADYYSSSESIRFANIAQQNHIQVEAPKVIVQVGGKEIVSAIKTYERANGSVWVSA
jgi:phage-related protein